MTASGRGAATPFRLIIRPFRIIRLQLFASSEDKSSRDLLLLFADLPGGSLECPNNPGGPLSQGVTFQPKESCVMNLSSRVLGKHVVDAISERAKAPLLKIGADVFFRHDFAQIECFNFTAAANLSRVLKHVRVKNLSDLYERVPPASLLLPRLGAVSLAVLGAAFELRQIGGEAPLENWMKFHQDIEDADLVTFGSLKARASHHEAGKETTRPKMRRRALAHAPTH